MGPYDNLIRYLWQNMERVEAELRAALPANLTSQLDFTSLERWPSTTVDARLTRREGDALFSVSLAGREALLYVLLEHQSSEDRFMALRVLIYMTRIWEQWRQENPQAHTLPVILPIVLFHGPSGWTQPRQFEDLLAVGPDWWESVAPFVPRFEFLLDDLSTVSEAELRAREGDDFYRLVTITLRRIQSGPEPLLEALSGNAELFAGIQSNSDASALFQLIFEVSDVDLGQLVGRLRSQLSRPTEEVAVTTAERLRAEGEARGKADALLKLLRAKFPHAVDATVESRVQAASLATLDNWFERGLSADDLGVVFETG